MRPVIGIVAGYNEERNECVLPRSYVEAIVEGGGYPLLIPLVPGDVALSLLSRVDGLLFPGGVDVDPRHYGERPSLHLGAINPMMDALELTLARKALETGMPILGICRGCQVVTVAAGGTLVQDIPTQVGGAMKHYQNAPRWYGTHEVILEEDSQLAVIHGTRRLVVNSFHHQSIKNPGNAFTVSAHALDGVVEGAEAQKAFRLLIQWHPECMWQRDRTFLAPFSALCEVARR